jgi:hypothetical protein
MTQTAQGQFDVQLTPLATPAGAETDQLGRMLIRKQFQGDLDATSAGEMLAHRSSVPGSAGYVAMERVEGRLAGRSGSFVLMHLGEMDRGQPPAERAGSARLGHRRAHRPERHAEHRHPRRPALLPIHLPVARALTPQLDGGQNARGCRHLE